MTFLINIFKAIAQCFQWSPEPVPENPMDDVLTPPATVEEPPTVSNGPVSPKTTPTSPVTPKPMPTDPDSIVYPWDSPHHNYHNFRVLCDKAGLTLEDKNTLCACVYQESGFHNSAVNHNAHSTDWGICQINDKIWCPHPFADANDIVDHPAKAANFMITMFKKGQLHLWVSYSSGAYHRWLVPSSPMWALAK